MEIKNAANPAKSDPKLFFLYVLAIIALYICTSSFIKLSFDIINYWLPDVTNRWNGALIQSFRWNTTALIVSFPTFIYTQYLIRQTILQYPEKLELPIRKSTGYLTIFLAVVIILANAFTLIYRLLSGDLTFSFILKIMVVFTISGFLFYFYQREIHQKWRINQLRLIGLLTTSIIVALISYSLVLVGSPYKARQSAFDDMKVGNLQSIQDKIIDYWKDHNKLPNNLAELSNAISGYKAPYDPQTNTAYDYQVISNLSFKLCANFNLASSEINSNLQYNNSYNDGARKAWNWQHTKGNYCFARTLDSKQYSVKNKKRK